MTAGRFGNAETNLPRTAQQIRVVTPAVHPCVHGIACGFLPHRNVLRNVPRRMIKRTGACHPLGPILRRTAQFGIQFLRGQPVPRTMCGVNPVHRLNRWMVCQRFLMSSPLAFGNRGGRPQQKQKQNQK